MSLSTPIASRRRFLIQAAIVTVALWLPMEWFKAHYRIGIATQSSTCLPGWRVFLMDLDDRTPQRDTVYAFRTRGIAVTLPGGLTLFRDGTEIAKIVAGLPGDTVEVGRDVTRVNGVVEGEGLDLARTLKKQPEDFVRRDTVPAGHFLFMGRTRDSYDGRYWGYVGADQLVGRAYHLY